MKYTIPLLTLSTALGIGELLPAQQNNALQLPENALRVRVQVRNRGSKRANVLSAVYIVPPQNGDPNTVSYIDSGTRTIANVPLKEFKVFFIETPPDLAKGLRSYACGDLEDARRQLEAVRRKYAGYIGMPHNPAEIAAPVELRCSVRLMDWPTLGKMVHNFPGTRYSGARDRATLDAARILAKVSDDPATAEERLREADELLAKKDRTERMSTEAYSWIKYAQGRALACSLTEEEIRNGIPAEKRAQAGKAVDAYCEAIMASRAQSTEILRDAAMRSFRLLWAMPGVRSYAKDGTEINKRTWKSAPADFRDAVTMAFLLKKVLLQGKDKDADPQVNKAAAFYYNDCQGKGKEGEDAGAK